MRTRIRLVSLIAISIAGLLAFYNSANAEILYSNGMAEYCIMPGDGYTGYNCDVETITNTPVTGYFFGSSPALPLLSANPEQLCLNMPYGSTATNVTIALTVGTGSACPGTMTFTQPFSYGENCANVPAAWTASCIQGRQIWFYKTVTAGTSDTKVYWGDLGFSFSLKRDLQDLSIRRPVSGQLSTVPLNANGYCNETPTHIMISDQPTYASSTPASTSFIDVTCQSNDLWYLSAYTASGERRFLTATDTDEFVQVFWYPSTQDDLAQDLTNELNSCVDITWACPMSYLSDWDPCAGVAMVATDLKCKLIEYVQFASDRISTTKPYSYVGEIYEGFKTGLTTTTGALPAAQFTLPTSTAGITHLSFDENLFSASTLTYIIPENAWTPIKTLTVGILYVLFGLYIYHRFKELT